VSITLLQLYADTVQDLLAPAGGDFSALILEVMFDLLN
jgi:hypothetical protein